MRRKALALTLASALLFSAVAGIQSTNLASGNPWGIFGPPTPPTYVYIRSDGTVEPSMVPIQKVGNVYTFTNDLLNYSIIVQRDNIVIEGAGFMLQGNGYYEGITLSSRNNV